MSGHPWWPDNDKSSWRMWHSPTYEDKKDAKEYWHKSWTKTWDWGSPTGAIPRKKLFQDSPDKGLDKGPKSHRGERPDKASSLPVTTVEIPDEFDSDDKLIDKNKRCGKDFPR